MISHLLPSCMFHTTLLMKYNQDTICNLVGRRYTFWWEVKELNYKLVYTIDYTNTVRRLKITTFFTSLDTILNLVFLNKNGDY